MLSVLKMYFQFGSSYHQKLYGPFLFILGCLFEGVQITALWIVFTAHYGYTLNSDVFSALGVMLPDIIGGVHLCSF